MRNPIQSSWGIVYYIDENDKQPRFLLLKRFALSKRIEWVAPKWKIEDWESPEQTALRETHEEIWVDQKFLVLKEKVWDLNLSLQDEERWTLDKDISFYLIKYIWDPTMINVGKVEWYIWVYWWFKIQDILWLVYYGNFRELFRKAYNMINETNISK